MEIKREPISGMTLYLNNMTNKLYLEHGLGCLAIHFVEGLDIRTISEQVMQQLFKVLAMHFEFSLQGIEKANITKTEGIK